MKIHWSSLKRDQRGPSRHPPGCLVALLGAPSGLYYLPGVKTLEREEFRSFATASWRKPTEKKKPSPAGRFRRGDHLWKGRSSSSSSSSSRASSISSSTSAPSPPSSHLISQLQLVL